MKLAIMQPYFFPYIGYFQLINAVDEFIVYDNIEFSKKGWVNRNRILANGKDEYITLPLKMDSDFLNIDQRFLADTWPTDRKKMLNKITESYRKAPHFKSAYPMVESCILFEEKNLFKFIFNSLNQVKSYLGIKTPFVISSQLPVEQTLRGQDKVIAYCKLRGSRTYLNPIGGLELYNKPTFQQEAIELFFLKANNVRYAQFANEFVPFLSILDVIMFNSLEETRNFLTEYTLQ